MSKPTGVSFIDNLYLPDERDSEIFGALYNPPKSFKHGQWHKICALKKREGSDGYAVEIDECRMPARFFRIRTLPSVNSMGEPQKLICLSTGSSMERLAFDIAKALNEGMLGMGSCD